MPKTKVAITLEKETVTLLDRLVKSAVFPSRSHGIQVALEEKLERIGHNRLARECAKLDPKIEKSLAEEGIAEDLSKWPEQPPAHRAPSTSRILPSPSGTTRPPICRT